MIVGELDVCAQLRTSSFKWSIKDFQGLDWQEQGQGQGLTSLGVYRGAQIKRHFTFLLVTNKCVI